MKNKTRAGFLLITIAAGLTGCDGASPTAPAPPLPQVTPTSTPTPAPPIPSFDGYSVADVTLSGMVFEMTAAGRVPIEGVRVTDYFHVHRGHSAVTDSRGFFSFTSVWVCPCSWAPWVDAGITSIWVDKEGYTVPAGQPTSVFAYRSDSDARVRDVTINGDTRFDVELVRR